MKRLLDDMTEPSERGFRLTAIIIAFILGAFVLYNVGPEVLSWL